MATLGKLVAAARALTGNDAGSIERNLDALIARLAEFTRVASLPGLASFGVTPEMAEAIAAAGNSKSSPVDFDLDQRVAMVTSAL